jgi:hypothetical protein
MNRISLLRLSLSIAAGFLAASTTQGQVSLTGTSYAQNFNSLASGLPAGWTVHTSATQSTFGNSATLTSTAITWDTALVGTDFRNVSSNNITYTTTGATQAANANRALGWRPVGSNSATVTPARTGAVMLSLSNTTGFQNFSLSVDLFGLNLTTTSQTYVLEYRVGNSGNFTSIGSYTTTATTDTSNYDNIQTLTANSVTLSALNDRSDAVYLRLRGTSASGSSNLDHIAIDNFALTYAVIPEPSTYAAIVGALTLAGVALHRRRQRAKAALP